jgi:hypothetical protein
MRAILKTIFLAAAAVALASCGGGGGGPNNSSAINPPATFTVTLTPESTSMPKAFFRQVTIRVSRIDGSPVAINTPINVASSGASATLLSRADDPATLGTDEFFLRAPTQTTRTGADGTAVVFFHSRETPGTYTITASVTDTANRVASGTTAITVTNDEPPFRQVAISTQRTTIPVNPGAVPGAQGTSPFQIEGLVTVRRLNGQLFSSATQGNSSQTVNVSVSPPGVAVFSTPDRLDTQDINEYTTLLVSGPVLLNASAATFYLHSLNQPGTVTMTFSFSDPDTLETVTVQRQFTVIGAVAPLPAQVSIATDGRPVYVQASGGNTTTQLTVQVTDATGNRIPDPRSGTTPVNNVLLEALRDGTGTGERLTGLNAAGQGVDGTSIRISTTNGVAGAAFRAGTGAGVVNLRATADRADNNVDNGIQDPVISVRSIIVSDGVLFAVELTNSLIDVLFQNPVSEFVTADSINAGPTGTYSLNVTALASDRQGNPVALGTPITFGSIDEPLTGYPQNGPGTFVIAGTDGDPQEGGRTFLSPLQGRFIIPGGQGAGPGDAVLVRGEESPGNVDLENARTIESIQSATQLTVRSRFNFNDVTGASVNNLAVLPYQIGRAQDGNIRSNVRTVLTNERGEAVTQITYPVTKLNKRVVIWAQGNGDIVQGSTETVEDIEDYIFFGAAPASMTAAPSEIDAGATTPVTICLDDNFGSPLPAVAVEGGVNSTTADFQVRIDGQLTPPPARLANRTGADGCTTAQVQAGALPGNSQIIVFRVPGTNLTAQVTVRPPRGARLRVSPAEIRGDDANARGGRPERVIATLSTNLGAAIPNANINTQCRVTQQPTVPGNTAPAASIVASPSDVGTNSAGIAEFDVSVRGLDAFASPGRGSCTVRVDAGGAVSTALSVDIPVVGIDLCSLAANANAPQCNTPRLTVRVAGACAPIIVTPQTQATCTVTSTPAGVQVTHPNAQTVQFPPRANGQPESVVLFATKTQAGQAPPLNVTFSGDCAAASGASNQTQPILMSAARSCTVTIQ